MTRYTFLAVASIGLAAIGIGCQHSGHAEATPDSSRPQMAAEKSVAVDTTTYTVPYSVTTDTPWMNTSIDTTAAGTLKAGDTVWLRSDASTAGIVGAKTSDGR